MDIRNYRKLKHEAQRSLDMAAYDPKMLVLLHTGVMTLFSLVITGLQFVVQNQIGATGGLGGMGLRSVLSTIQEVLRITELAVMPFWEIGYVFVVLRLARAKNAQPGDMLSGFRHFGPVLRLTLLQAARYILIAILSFYFAVQVFTLTPWAEPLMKAMEPLVNQTTVLNQTVVMDEAVMAAMSDAILPILGIFAVVYMIAAGPLFYGLRMSAFCLADAPERGALLAMRESRIMMRGNRLKLLGLDLSFWWYYLLHVVLIGICYADVLLPLVGITLPWSGTVSFFLFYILSMVCQLGLYYLVKNQVEVTYAVAYDTLKLQPEEPAEVRAPRNQPWNY